MGGFVGMRLAIRYPELIRSLILMETTADPEPEENKGPYRKLAFIGRWLGFRLVVDRLMNIMFGQSFLTDPSRSDVRNRWLNHLLKLNRKGTGRAAHGVIDRQGIYEQLDRVNSPTLIIVGDEDVATVPLKSERMHAAIQGSMLEVIARAGHSSAAVNAAIRKFLETLPPDQNL
jgi:pimeloyl-ACP methyl ester carboxylesterase